MDATGFALACALLLATPGPTNSLLATAGSEGGFLRSLRLVPAETAGYVTAVLAAHALGSQISGSPAASAGIRAVAAAWMMWSAVKMWRAAKAASQRSVGAATLSVTTLTNPKALVVGLVLIPAEAPALPHVAAFAAMVALFGTAWIGVGALASSAGRGVVTPSRLRKVSAAVLAAFSGMAATAAAAALG